MEYLSLGDLRQQHENSRITGWEVKELICQILCALDYLHSRKITHRDIKPQNILVQGASFHVKLGDFGLSKGDLYLKTTCGTEEYIAPKIWDRRYQFEVYTNAVDLWSLGVVILEYTYGLPESADDGRHWCQKMVYEMDSLIYDQLHQLRFLHLLSKMLQMKYPNRSSAGDCLEKARGLDFECLKFSESDSESTTSTEEMTLQKGVPADPDTQGSPTEGDTFSAQSRLDDVIRDSTCDKRQRTSETNFSSVGKHKRLRLSQRSVQQESCRSLSFESMDSIVDKLFEEIHIRGYIKEGTSLDNHTPNPLREICEKFTRLGVISLTVVDLRSNNISINANCEGREIILAILTSSNPINTPQDFAAHLLCQLRQHGTLPDDSHYQSTSAISKHLSKENHEQHQTLYGAVLALLKDLQLNYDGDQIIDEQTSVLVEAIRRRCIRLEITSFEISVIEDSNVRVNAISKKGNLAFVMTSSDLMNSIASLAAHVLRATAALSAAAG